MRRKRSWIVVGGLALPVALAAVLLLGLSGGTKKTEPKAEPVARFAPTPWRRLWAATRVGQSRAAVLARWPKPPYQHYHDNLAEDCYEWQGDELYNLCFMHGRLHLKTFF